MQGRSLVRWSGAIALIALLVAPAGAVAHEDRASPVSYPATAMEPAAWYSSHPVGARLGASDANRFTLAGGCFRLRPIAAQDFVAKSAAGYVTSASAAGAEVFRMQASELGRYLLLGSDGHMPSTADGALRVATQPVEGAVWTVRGDPGRGYELVSGEGRLLGFDPERGELTLTQRGGGRVSTRFAFEGVATCGALAEIPVNARGRPNTSRPRYGEATGLIDIHAHILAFDAWGGNEYHCGRPWHSLGPTRALADCPVRHSSATPGGLSGNLLAFGDPAYPHHPGGWPAFEGWPTHQTVFIHERAYYRWIERTWRGGLRLLTMLAVDNSGACMANPERTESCNEMDAVRRQLRDARELQDYIDAQWGGPGKGFFRIVRNPFQARRVINRGKLAVVLGIEVSEPFDCGLRDGKPQCDEAQIDTGLDEVYRAGVRQMELMNKFDNALGGVALDSGAAGPVVNVGNKIVTGRFWDVETCTGPDHDNTQISSVPPESEALISLFPGGPYQLPVYPPPPHCNKRGLTDLGRYAIRGLMKRGMIFDPDHMSVLARSAALDLVEAHDYGGIVSSHSWADDTSYRRILELGGIVTPYLPSTPQEYVGSWQARRKDIAQGHGARRFRYGFGFASDVNGFGGRQGPAGGTEAEISYPFTSIDRAVTLDRQQSGTRTFDYNTDGVAHYGLHPDFFEGLRRLGRRGVVRDSLRGAEAYLQMWERAKGIRGPRCRRRHRHIDPNGSGRVQLGLGPAKLLRRAGQPQRRGRAWRYCVRSRGGGRADLVAVFPVRTVGLVATNSRAHSVGDIRVGARASRLPDDADGIGGGLWLSETGHAGRSFVYVVRAGRVRAAGVAASSIAEERSRLAKALRIAKLG